MVDISVPLYRKGSWGWEVLNKWAKELDHFMATGGETMEIVTYFIFLGSKITADGECSHEIERHLLLGSKAMTNLDSILKGRHIIYQQKSI